MTTCNPPPRDAALGIAGQRGQQLQGPGEGTAPCHDVIEIQAHQGQAAQVEVWPQNQANPVAASGPQQVQGATERQVPAAIQGLTGYSRRPAQRLGTLPQRPDARRVSRYGR